MFAIISNNCISSAIPFQKKSCKLPRLLVHGIVDTCVGLFYKILAAGAWLICCRGAARRFSALGCYQLTGALNLLTYMQWRKKLIDFSHNTNDRPRLFPSFQEDELALMKRVYGADKVEAYVESLPPELVLNKKKLRPRCSSDGLCMGQSLDFIAKYLKLRKEGKPPIAAINEIAPSFAKRPSLEAELLQSFHHAVTTEKSYSHKTFDECVSDKPFSELDKAKAQMAIEKTEIIKKEIRKQCREYLKKNLDPQYKYLAKQLGLQLDFSEYDLRVKSCCSKKIFSKIMQSFSPGAYLLQTIRPEDPSAHVFVFIKEQEETFLFEANYGTIQSNLSELSNTVWKNLWNLFEKKRRIHFLRFTLL